jgi:putative inorganic carbon (HCO3(-)) transporter
VATLLTTSTLIAIYGLYQYKIGVPPLATWEDPNIENPATRIYSTFGNPNLLAGYLVPLVPLAMSLALATIASRKWLIALFPLLAACLMSLAIILTGSRGGYLGLLAGMCALFAGFASFIWARRPTLKPFVLAFLLFFSLSVFLAIHFVPSFEQRIISIFAGREHSSNSFRLNVWLSSLAMLKDNWWFGIGVGNEAFRLAYGLYMTSGFDALGTYCVPLEIAVETGLLGLVVFALLVVTALARAHLNFWNTERTAWQRCLIAGAAFGLIGLMVHGLVDTVFYRPQVHFIFWLLIALMITPAEGKAASVIKQGD